MIEVLAAFTVFCITSLCVFISISNILNIKIYGKYFYQDIIIANNICEYFKTKNYNEIQNKISGSNVSFYMYFDNIDDFMNQFNNHTIISGQVSDDYKNIDTNLKRYGAYINLSSEYTDENFYKVTVSLWDIKNKNKNKIRLTSYAGR